MRARTRKSCTSFHALLVAAALIFAAPLTAQAACLGGTPNGAVTAGELCDDGNTLTNDNCLNDCTWNTCGDTKTHTKGLCSGAPYQQCLVNADCSTPAVCVIHNYIEVCDDGNTASADGCRSDCKSNETCPNGLLDVAVGEACDDGNTVNGDACDSNCTVPACGNGIVTVGENCDDGNTVSGDGCSFNCLSDETCPNPFVDVGEACDDGNTVSGDGCDTNCTASACGNGIMAGAEACDDGNTVSGDGCSFNCVSTEYCGNGIGDVGEACDDGNTNNCDACHNDCTSNAGCGDGDLCPPEVCDDGNTVGGDGCSFACNSAEVCGNSIVDVGETCDDGNTASGDGCDSNCKPTGCGNGVATAGEACDDGNTVNGDGCDNNCTATACGNWYITAGETCDDGNTVSGDGCDSNCKPTGCGNGVVTVGEVCDDGNTASDDGCRGDCLSDETCGNGTPDVAAGEACDWGTAICTTPSPFAAWSGKECTTADGKAHCDADAGTCGFGNLDYTADYCRGDCQLPKCGDEVLDTGEGCDDGMGRGNPAILDSLDSADTCPNGPEVALAGMDCKIRNVCGDAIPLLFDSSADCVGDCPTTMQLCDSGGGSFTYSGGFPGLGAPKTCKGNPLLYCSIDADCGAAGPCGRSDTVANACRMSCTPAGCGDDTVDTGESCDEGASVCFGGTYSGACSTVAGNTSCITGGGACGDAAGGDYGANCTNPANCNHDVTGGACRSNCALPTCGDGAVDPGEACDNGANNGVTGTCTSTCTLNTCGDGEVLGGEQCDDGNAVITDACHWCWNNTCGNGIQNVGVEACDDGNAVNGDGCDVGCVVTGCGNGVVTAGELCDDGNTVGGDGCSPACGLEVCGDGDVDTAVGESCDDGNLSDGDGCGSNCCADPTIGYVNMGDKEAAVECNLDALDADVAAVPPIPEKPLSKRAANLRKRVDQAFDLIPSAKACGKLKSASNLANGMRRLADNKADRGQISAAEHLRLNSDLNVLIGWFAEIRGELGCL